MTHVDPFAPADHPAHPSQVLPALLDAATQAAELNTPPAEPEAPPAPRAVRRPRARRTS